LEDGEVSAISNEMDEIWANDPLFHMLASSTSNYENPSKENENTSFDMLLISDEMSVQESNAHTTSTTSR